MFRLAGQPRAHSPPYTLTMPLRLIKSALFGALVAICGLLAWVVVGLQGIAVTGAGGLGAVSGGVSDAGVLLVSLTCFALGSTWMYRRLRRQAVR
jgi:hypothetical protein